jgi:hypothetical protein
MTLFDLSLCDKRWTVIYYQSSQRIFTSKSTDADSHNQLGVTQTSMNPLECTSHI